VSRPIAWFDRTVVDGTLDRIAAIAQKTATFIRPLQGGNVQSYCIFFLSGALAIVLALLYLYR
jgi:NADH-quinone oxidoreductase subunit L